MRLLLKQKSVLPGFGLTLGYSLFYLGLVVLIPISMLLLKSSAMGSAAFFEAAFSPRVLASYRLTFGASFVAASLNTILGFLIAWVLVRYSFPGKKIVDMLVDLPFALPTAVAGIALTSIYSSNGWMGKILEPHGIKIALTPYGITLALLFIGFPFVVRTVQPVLEDLDADMEEAAASLGASRLQVFIHVIFPALLPSLLAGFTLAFARALGEYGSVIFISSNMPLKTEVTSLLIISKLEQYDYAGATAIASVMLIISFILLLIINFLQGWIQRRQQGERA